MNNSCPSPRWMVWQLFTIFSCGAKHASQRNLTHNLTSISEVFCYHSYKCFKIHYISLISVIGWLLPPVCLSSENDFLYPWQIQFKHSVLHIHLHLSQPATYLDHHRPISKRNWKKKKNPEPKIQTQNLNVKVNRMYQDQRTDNYTCYETLYILSVPHNFHWCKKLPIKAASSTNQERSIPKPSHERHIKQISIQARSCRCAF